MVVFNKTVIIAVYIAIGFYLAYRVLFRKTKIEEDYEKLYDHILTSDKYKVKGQFDEIKWFFVPDWLKY